jgi:asparagine synthase (glutamine-hydrolysing)
MPWELPAVLDPELVGVGLDRLALVERGDEAIRGIDNAYAAVTVLEMTHYMRDRLLRDSDWASMAHSLELRVPLVDWTLFQTLAPLIASESPPRKGDLARVPRQDLPQEVVQRRKTGFEVPVRDWLLGGRETGGAGRGLRDWSKLIDSNFAPA